MRKTIAITVASIGLLGMGVAFAAKPMIQMNQSQVQNLPQNELVFMYSAPNKERLIKKLPANAALVPIFRKGNWIKMGDRANGIVGWVNRTQLDQARDNFYRPDVQTFFVNVEQNNQGKPMVSVIAFKNGKKLTEQQAREMYNKIRRQQEQQFRNMQQLNNQVNTKMFRDFQAARRLFDSAWMNPPMTQGFEPAFMYPQMPPLSDQNQTSQHKTKKQKQF